VNDKKNIFLFAVALLCAGIFAGCRTTGSGEAVGGLNYTRPESVDVTNYAIRERIDYLERQLDTAINTNRQLSERLEAARSTAQVIKESSDAIRELSRRSSVSVQEIIGKMEALSDWIDWVTSYINRLENLLADQVQPESMVFIEKEDNQWALKN